MSSPMYLCQVWRTVSDAVTTLGRDTPPSGLRAGYTQNDGLEKVTTVNVAIFGINSLNFWGVITVWMSFRRPKKHQILSPS